jgi:hypothetical protein
MKQNSKWHQVGFSFLNYGIFYLNYVHQQRRLIAIHYQYLNIRQVLNRRLNNKELNDLFSPSNIIRVMTSRVMRWAEHVARRGEARCIQGFCGEVWEKEPRSRCEDNIKRHVEEVGWGACIGLAGLTIGTGGGHLWTR